MDDLRVAAVTTPQPTPDQVEDFFVGSWRVWLRRLRPRSQNPPAVDQFHQRLVVETQARQPVPAAVTGSAGLETLLRNFLSGNLAPVRQPRHDTISPVASSPLSSHYARSAKQESETSRVTRRGRRQMRPVRILQDVGVADFIGVADLADAGILFPAVPAGIPFPADPAGILFRQTLLNRSPLVWLTWTLLGRPPPPGCS